MSNLKNQKFIDRFENFNQTYQLFEPYQKILLAISGGMDSMAMLHLFLAIRAKYRLSLAVAHINHGLRGKASDADEQFVQSISRNYGFPFFSIKCNVKMISQERKITLEQAGREIRFRFFHQIINRNSYQMVALAHHADDRAETILMHLFRGSGIRGLTGILPKREMIIHPLLFLTRQEIESFIMENKIRFRVDQSNFSKRFLRNRIRWEILPKIKAIYGHAVITSICRTGDIAAEVDTWEEKQVMEAIAAGVLIHKQHEFILDIHKYLRYFTPIQKGLLKRAIKQIRPETPYVNHHELRQIESLIENGQGHAKVILNDRSEVIRSGEKIVFRPCPKKISNSISVLWDEWNILPEFGGKIRIRRIHREDIKIQFSNNPFIEFVDADALRGNFIVRSWHEGDRFQPYGMQGSKKIQDFFIDSKVPNHVRHRIPILEDHGQIIWIIGYRISDKIKMKPTSKNIVQMQWVYN